MQNPKEQAWEGWLDFLLCLQQPREAPEPRTLPSDDGKPLDTGRCADTKVDGKEDG